MVALETREDRERYGLVLRDLTSAAGRPQPASSGGILPWLRNMSTPVILSNERGRITGLNPAAEDLLGWTAAEIEGNGLFSIFRPDSPKLFNEEIAAELSRTRCWKSRAAVHQRSGSTVTADVELVPAHDEVSGARGFITSIQPVAEKAAAPLPGGAAPRACVTLHRARNDFQVISSLLTLQADHEPSPDARNAILAVKDRITAVALIYRLITGENDRVDFLQYARETGRTLLDNHKIDPARIQIETAMDAVLLEQKTALTLGLILGEIIASLLSGTFAGNASGTIRIRLTAGGSDGILAIDDTGALLTPALLEQRRRSFPWQIIELLCGQIGGVLTVLNDDKNEIRLGFRLNPAA